MMYRKICRDCQHEFLTPYRRRVYCCARCRRHYQDERRKEERAEFRDFRDAGKLMTDPWSKCDIDDCTADDILKNALLDPVPYDL